MNVRQGVFLLIACIGFWSLSASLDAQQVQIRGPKNGGEQLSGNTYGPITPEDTLWRIANRYRQNKNLSVYQVMQGIYELNPDAFEDQNFNHIKDGAVLNLPSERYVARIDPEQARLKAEQDDTSWLAFTKGETKTLVVAKPATTVSKEDLSETKQGIEQKITDLDAEQSRQFMAIRQQFAESIDGVQSLLNENRKLVERLDVVDQEIGNLRGRVDEELQVQMDQMLALQNELLAISKEAEMQRVAEAQKSSFDWLTDPIFLIFLSILLVISLLGAFAMWMIRRNRSPISSDEQAIDPAAAAVLEQSDEMDDLADALANELSDDIGDDDDDDLFGDEDLLDDVLSDELEESLDSAIDDEFDSFDDLDDDSLDPMIEEASESLEDDGLLDQEDLDNLFDEDDDDLLADIEGELDDLEESQSEDFDADSLDEADAELDSLLDGDDDDSFELSETDLEQALETPKADVEEPAATPITDSQVDDVTDDLEESLPEPDAIQSVDEDEPDKPEISIDELLEPPEVDIPDSIMTDNSDLMNEEMLQNIDKEIASQNEQLDEMTDELLNEIEQLEQMGGMLDEIDGDEEEPRTTESQMGIQELDALSEDLDEESDDIPELDDIDSLLAQNQADDKEASIEEVEDSADVDDIDSLLEKNQAADEGVSIDEVEDSADADDMDSLLDQNQAADEGVSIDEVEDSTDTDDINSLLEQNQAADDETKSEVLDEEDEQQDDLPEDVLAQPSISNESVESLSADELLAELENQSDAESQTEIVDDKDESDNVLDITEAEDESDDASQRQHDNEPSAESTDELELDDQEIDETSIDEILQDSGDVDTEAESLTPDIEELDKALEEFEQDLDDPSLAFGGELDDQKVTPAGADELQLDDEQEDVQSDIVKNAESDRHGDIPSIGDLDSLSESQDSEFDDADLDEALKAFDENLVTDDMESTPSATDAAADSDVELDDLPGLGDWLSSEEAEADTSIDDLEKTSFDELLDSIDEPDEATESVDDAIIKELDESGLDFNALLNEANETDKSTEDNNEGDFLDVDDLINESMDAEGSDDLDKELNLDAALESYAGIGNAEQVDVDGDNGIGAKLDLAQAYIETDDIDSATELLEDIISAGDEEQQQEAKELLASLKS